MNNFKRLKIFLWNIDPGYFRLKHAAKTILAILIALWFVRGDTIISKAMAGIACGMSMQGVVAKSFFSRFLQIVLFDLAFFGAFVLGLAVRDSFNLRALTLMCLGFTVNYLRRFGLHNSQAPMMIWILCFIAIVLPFPSTAQAWEHLHGLIIGLSVSAVVMLSFFPENYPRLFVSNSNRLFKALSVGLLDIRRYLLIADTSLDFERSLFMHVKVNLNYLLDSNQTVDQSTVFYDQQKLIDEIMIREYALANAYTIIIEAYQALRVHDYKLSRSIRLTLSTINKQFATLLASAKMHDDYSVTARAITIALPKLAEKLTYERLMDPTLVMILLNLKLSFHLLNQQLSKLLRGDDAT